MNKKRLKQLQKFSQKQTLFMPRDDYYVQFIKGKAYACIIQ